VCSHEPHPHPRRSRMVEISLSGSGEGPGWATAPGYSTAGFLRLRPIGNLIDSPPGRATRKRRGFQRDGRAPVSVGVLRDRHVPGQAPKKRNRVGGDGVEAQWARSPPNGGVGDRESARLRSRAIEPFVVDCWCARSRGVPQPRSPLVFEFRSSCLAVWFFAALLPLSSHAVTTFQELGTLPSGYAAAAMAVSAGRHPLALRARE